MNSEAILDYAAQTDPFRLHLEANAHSRRTSSTELEKQKSRGEKMTLWKGDCKDNKHERGGRTCAKHDNCSEDRLVATDNAACLTFCSTSSAISDDST